MNSQHKIGSIKSWSHIIPVESEILNLTRIGNKADGVSRKEDFPASSHIPHWLSSGSFDVAMARFVCATKTALCVSQKVSRCRRRSRTEVIRLNIVVCCLRPETSVRCLRVEHWENYDSKRRLSSRHKRPALKFLFTHDPKPNKQLQVTKIIASPHFRHTARRRDKNLFLTLLSEWNSQRFRDDGCERLSSWGRMRIAKSFNEKDARGE